MDRKMLTLILGLALVGCFFLPYLDLGFFGKISGYDLVFKSNDSGSNWEKYIWAVIPVAGILLFIGAINNENYIFGRGLLTWLPFLALLYLLIITQFVHGEKAEDVIKTLGQSYGIGLWITIGVSLILAFYNPKPKT